MRDSPTSTSPSLDWRNKFQIAARFARGLVHGNPLIDQIKVRGGGDPDRIVDAIAGR